MKNRIIFGLLFSIFLIGIMPNAGSLVIADLNDDLFEDFEGIVFPAWTTTGLWHLEDNDTSSYPMYGLPSDSHYMWYGDNRTGNYNTTSANSGELFSDTFDLSGIGSSAYLEFWSWADTEYGDQYDIKQVFISPDNGLSWVFLGNITVNGEPRWELFSYNISSYVTYTSVQLKFFFDTVDAAVNEGHGWIIDDVSIITDPTGFFDLWINQENMALTGETHQMEFNVESFFSHDMNVSMKIQIFDPNGTESVLYEVSNYFFPAYSTWNISKNFTFDFIGHYDVRFSLVDDMENTWETFCWWDVSSYADEYFDIWIEQEYHTMIGETEWMDFFAYSNSNSIRSNVTIKIEITGPSSELLFFNESLTFSPYGMWNLSLNYTFMYDGMYDVSFFLWDDTGLFFEAWCNWEVKPFYEHFEVNVVQENFAVVDNYGFMGFNVQSFFNHNMSVQIIIEIIDSYGNVDELYNGYVFIPANGTWYYPVSYLFETSNHYDVHISLIDDIGAYWEAWCWYEVFDYSHEFLWLDIHQEQHAYVGEDRWMQFEIYSNYSYSFFDVTIEAIVETPSFAYEQLFLFENETLSPLDWWKTDMSYTFNETGTYNIIFKVTLVDGTSWTHTCGWIITDQEQPTDKLEPFIDSDLKAVVNVTKDFYIGVYNYYKDNQDFFVEVVIFHPDGNEIFRFTQNVSNLEPGNKWKILLNYTFQDIGDFPIKVVVNNGDSSFMVDSFFDVYYEIETNTSVRSTTEPPTETPTISLTPGFELFLVTLVVLPLVYSKKRRR